MKEQDTYSFEVVRTASYAYHFFPVHTLVYLYGGRLHLRNQCGESLSVERGDCAFIGRDSYSYLYAEPVSDASCRMTFFSLSRQFLCEFYQTLDAMQRTCRENLFRHFICCPVSRKRKVFSIHWLPICRTGKSHRKKC